MATEKQITVTISADLVADIDAWVAAQEARLPGVNVSLSGAVRALLRRGLDAEAQPRLEAREEATP